MNYKNNCIKTMKLKINRNLFQLFKINKNNKKLSNLQNSNLKMI